MLFEPNSPGINKLTRRYKASTTNPNLEALHNDASPLANEKGRRLPWSDATHLDLLWILNLPDRHVVVPRPVTAICTRRLKLCKCCVQKHVPMICQCLCSSMELISLGVELLTNLRVKDTKSVRAPTLCSSSSRNYLEHTTVTTIAVYKIKELSAWSSSRQYITYPNNALFRAISSKFSLYLHCLIPQISLSPSPSRKYEYSNLLTPVKSGLFLIQAIWIHMIPLELPRAYAYACICIVVMLPVYLFISSIHSYVTLYHIISHHLTSYQIISYWCTVDRLSGV